MQHLRRQFPNHNSHSGMRIQTVGQIPNVDRTLSLTRMSSMPSVNPFSLRKVVKRRPRHVSSWPATSPPYSWWQNTASQTSVYTLPPPHCTAGGKTQPQSNISVQIAITCHTTGLKTQLIDRKHSFQRKHIAAVGAPCQSGLRQIYGTVPSTKNKM